MPTPWQEQYSSNSHAKNIYIKMFNEHVFDNYDKMQNTFDQGSNKVLSHDQKDPGGDQVCLVSAVVQCVYHYYCS